MTEAQPILTRNTDIHESVHSQDWVRDEINARKAEINFLTKVVAALKKLEKMVK